MSKIKYLLAAICGFVAASTAMAQPAKPTIRSVAAQQVKQYINESTGPTIINFWASWCGPCTREITYMEAQVKASTKPVKLLLVSMDFPQSYPKLLQQFINKQQYQSEVFYLHDLDTKVVSSIIEPQWNGAIPVSIFVDNTKHYYRFFGFQLTPQRLALELENMLQ